MGHGDAIGLLPFSTLEKADATCWQADEARLLPDAIGQPAASTFAAAEGILEPFSLTLSLSPKGAVGQTDSPDDTYLGRTGRRGA